MFIEYDRNGNRAIYSGGHRQRLLRSEFLSHLLPQEPTLIVKGWEILRSRFSGKTMTDPGEIDGVGHGIGRFHDRESSKPLTGRGSEASVLSCTGLDFSWNLLNLPCEVSDSSGTMLMRYTYLSDGTKAVKPSEDSQLSPDFPFVPIVQRVQDNNYRFAGKEEYVFGNGDSSLLDFGARYYDPWSCQWTAVDPLAEKYSGMSPYGYCASNPLVFVDPFGLRTHVFQNADGTYTVTDYGNPDPEDGDNNIYVGYLDKDGNWVNTGFSIGVSATPYSFYNSDGNQWISGAIIDPGDNSGIDFLDSMNPSVSLEEYMSKAGTGKEWDFKVTNGIAGNEPNIKQTYVYRGMPIDVNATGQKVFASGRDVGNIAAGKIAAIHGMPWALTALATDCYQLYSTYKRSKAGSPDKMEGYKLEGKTTKTAQRYGWNVGCLIHENMYNVLSWKRGK